MIFWRWAGEGLASRGCGLVYEPKARTAFRTGNGLGMKAPVGRIAIFFSARPTKRKAGHAGHGPVIRYGASNGETRSAVGAVGKSIAETAIFGVAHFGQTIGAQGYVWADQHGMACAALALENAELKFTGYRLNLGLF